MQGDSAAFVDALTALATVVGLDVPPDATLDEHVRWPIDEEAVRRPEARRALLRLVGVEQWSDWLQRRVSRDGGHLAVMDALAVGGRSRRVRAQAAEHARRMRKRLSS